MDADGRRSLASSRARLRSQRLTDRREDSASRLRDEGPRTAVKERGRRQSGGMISLSGSGKNETGHQMLISKGQAKFMNPRETKM